MSKPVRWGVLSGSNFAATTMAPAIHEAEGAVLDAVATADPAKAARFQAFHPGIRVLPDYDGLLADPDIDAVYVPLPNSMHVDWTERALRAGKHVLTEKPIAVTAEEIDRLIALRDETGLLAAEAFMIVHHPQWQKARALLSEGAVGRLRHVDAAFSFFNDDAGNIRNRAEVAGGSLRDIGVYTMGSVRFATGEEPVSVECSIDWEKGIDATAHVAARFPSFTYRSMTSMRMCPRQEVIFHGTEALLRVPAPFNAAVFGEEQVILERADRSIERFRFPGTRQYKLQVEAFCRTVRDGAAYPWRLEDAKGTQAMMDRAYAAAGPAG
ncbi:Gfo/Idh/MocA family protein [Frigidibacter sp. ROC022]|uniref:Gfo/Idh/MocA family protein n=1 Tax=Frigidibacter sp. ROC022 TaxID=2971796 RepID=UPI00215A400C|nr:Gfo/Idh/MocA family oxidoreductase [Frigidibacter sp. ROC022]MCR8725314.1 Gfo/Idh/MocA family oxidoreductase [Frigidibacter sp. ROC022]